MQFSGFYPYTCCAQGSKWDWDGMDRYGTLALSWPPEKHTGNSFLRKVIPV